MFKVKMILLAVCLSAVAGSSLYAKGWGDGIASIDQEAFDSYIAVAHQMKTEKHKHPHAKADDVFAKAGF